MRTFHDAGWRASPRSLANLYLDVLDRELARRGLSFVRLADDIAAFLASERAAERLLGRLARWLHRHLDLEVNAAKSGAHRTEETALLGFGIHPGGHVSPEPKAIERLKDRVRALWDARQSLTTQQLRGQWQRYIRGWWNHSGFANRRREVHALSGWVRPRLRKGFWLRWHNRHGRRKALQRLGVHGRALGVAGRRPAMGKGLAGGPRSRGRSEAGGPGREMALYSPATPAIHPI